VLLEGHAKDRADHARQRAEPTIQNVGSTSTELVLAWETPDGSDRWELVDGVPVAMASASDRHAMIQAEAARLLGNHFAEHRQEFHDVARHGFLIRWSNISECWTTLTALCLSGADLRVALRDCRVLIAPGTRPNEHNVRIPDLSVACGPIGRECDAVTRHFEMSGQLQPSLHPAERTQRAAMAWRKCSSCTAAGLWLRCSVVARLAPGTRSP
jgi:hypothetical protein